MYKIGEPGSSCPAGRKNCYGLCIKDGKTCSKPANWFVPVSKEEAQKAFNSAAAPAPASPAQPSCDYPQPRTPADKCVGIKTYFNNLGAANTAFKYCGYGMYCNKVCANTGLTEVFYQKISPI